MNTKKVVAAVAAMQYDNKDPARQALLKLQLQQEECINAGYRPERAIKAIFDLEKLRRRVIRCERNFYNALQTAELEGCDIMANEVHGREI